MRFLAFVSFGLAAVDAPPPFLDRLGVAALGLAFLALAIGAAAPLGRRGRAFGFPPERSALTNELDESAATLAERLGDYGL